MDVELECAVYGEGTVFPVKIARNAKVSALQKAIVNEKKDVNHRFKVDPAKLTLYLAGKKEGNEIKWLKDDSNLDDLLRGDVDKKYMKMRSSWNLNDEELLGPDFMPKGKEIHVLVDLEDRGDFIFTQSKRQRMEPMLRSQWFLSDVKQLGHVELTMDEWLDMTYNGNVLSLKLKDEQFVNEEKRKAIGFRYFDMDFPVLLSKNEGMLQSVFIRPCYERILDLLRRDIKNRRPSIVITGNPGVGKSRFYAYCAFCFSKEKLDDRVLVLNTGAQYFLWEDGRFHLLDASEVPVYMYNINVIRLIDGRSDALLAWSGVSILFTSPGCPDYREFLKASRVEYIMPPWTEKEMRIAASVAKLNVQEVIARYNYFGGIARYVFSHDASEFKSEVTEAMSLVDLLQIFRAVGVREEVSEKKYSHRLLHMYPRHEDQHEYRGFFLDFASEEIANKIYDRMVEKCFEKLTEFIVANEEDANTGGFRGTLFEIFCHRMWLNIGIATLEGKLLDSDGQDRKFLIEVPNKVDSCRFSDLIEIPPLQQDIPLYCRPTGKSFPCVDAIYWNGKKCYLLQMTISDKHGIVHAPLVKILDWCGTLPYVFVFVVPEWKVATYKRQNLLSSTGAVHKRPCKKAYDLKQYVVGVKVLTSRS